MKKLSFVICASLLMCSCSSETITTPEPIPTISIDVSKENQEEIVVDDFTKEDDALKKLVSSSRSVIAEIDWETYGASNISAVMEEWAKPLGFDGFKKSGEVVEILSFLPEDCDYNQYLQVRCGNEEKIIYQLEFYDLEKIPLDSTVLKLQGLYAVKIDRNDFEEMITSFKENLSKNDTDETVSSQIVYDEEGLLINLYALNHKTHGKIITLYSFAY